MKYIGEIKFYVELLLTLKFSRIQGRLIPVIFSHKNYVHNTSAATCR